MVPQESNGILFDIECIYVFAKSSSPILCAVLVLSLYHAIIMRIGIGVRSIAPQANKSEFNVLDSTDTCLATAKTRAYPAGLRAVRLPGRSVRPWAGESWRTGA